MREQIYTIKSEPRAGFGNLFAWSVKSASSLSSVTSNEAGMLLTELHSSGVLRMQLFIQVIHYVISHLLLAITQN